MEQLILDLNSPQNQARPEVINNIQRQIQRLQREQSAWQTGLDLLRSDIDILQFYGALTIGLKVNADWDNDKIGENRDILSQLLQVLITSYVSLSAQSSSSHMVVNKLSTVLAAIFAKPDAAWAHPCGHVLACMVAGRFIPEKEAPRVHNMLAIDSTISASSMRSVLRLGLALQEEASSGQNKAGHRYESRLFNNAEDVWQIIQFALTWICDVTGTIDESPRHSGLQLQGVEVMYDKLLEEICVQIPSWTKIIEAETSEKTLNAIFAASLSLLLSILKQDSMAEPVIPCLTALQVEHPRLVARSVSRFTRQVNESAAALALREEFRNGNFSSEAISYGEFLEAIVSQLDLTKDEYLKDEDVLFVLQIAQELFKIDGAAVVEDEICQMILEMMTSVAEGYSDWNEPSQFDKGMVSLITETCTSTLRKVRFPPEQLDRKTATWDEDEFTKFEDFRFSASDFFQTAFGILGSPLGMDFAVSITQDTSADRNGRDISWSNFEAAIFGLTSLSDGLSNESEQCDPCLTYVFECKQWNAGISSQEEVPSRARRAMIRLLGETTGYLQRNPRFLISSLDFLFRSLQVKTHSNHAAKAIYNLCDSQRALLVQALPQFLQTITTLEHIPLLSRCKILSGVAALVQALPSEAERIEPLQKMLMLIQDLGKSSTTQIAGTIDELSQPLFERVSMIAALAKGLQSPADTPIDLDSIESSRSTFWIEGDGMIIQQAAIQMLSEPWSHLLEPDSSDLVGAACDFLRAGFKEQHPSPLKFSSITSVEMLTALVDLKNPNLDQTMNTISCYVASTATPSSSQQSASEADTIITAVLSITKETIDILSSQTIDPNFSAPTSILDFVIRSIPKYALYIFKHASALEIMDTIMTYAILLLRSTTDTLPRRSAAAFFTAFIEISDPTSKISADPTAATTLTTLLEKYTPNILALILHLLAGECARSEIETLTETLRKFVLRQPMRSKRIMQEAMKAESGVLTEKALNATKPELRARFIAQVEGLRGAKKTNEVVREFWVNCKGGQFGYIA